MLPLTGRRELLAGVGEMLRVENWGWNLASTGSEWSFTFDRRVRRFSDAITVEDYWQEAHPEPEVPPPALPAAAFESFGPIGVPAEPPAAPEWTSLLHPSIVAVAVPRIRAGHADNAIEEAWKVTAERLRQLSAIDSDGVPLVNQALGTKGTIKLADRSSDRGRDEHDGYADLLRGYARVGRNPRAHRPSAPDVSESDLAFFLLLAVIFCAASTTWRTT